MNDGQWAKAISSSEKLQPEVLTWLKNLGQGEVFNLPTGTDTIGACFTNVLNRVDKNGGTAVLGWMIASIEILDANLMLMATREMFSNKSDFEQCLRDKQVIQNQTQKILYQAIPHCIWQKQNGEIVDVTEGIDDVKTIHFIHDPSMRVIAKGGQIFSSYPILMPDTKKFRRVLKGKFPDFEISNTVLK